jgi:hypothetical protein
MAKFSGTKRNPWRQFTAPIRTRAACSRTRVVSGTGALGSSLAATNMIGEDTFYSAAVGRAIRGLVREVTASDPPHRRRRYRVGHGRSRPVPAGDDADAMAAVV